ncbi:MAG: sporulation protein YabP, partial [Clostridia bacterium]|nr:sporulation protein YabP [Clostridia bacterium]
LLTIKGQNLKINKLSIDTSEVIVEGEVSSLAYSEANQGKSSGSLLGKIFK